MPRTITINSRRILINSTGTMEILNIHHKSSNSNSSSNRMLTMVKAVMAVVMLLLIFIDKEVRKIRVMEIKRQFKVVKWFSLGKISSSSSIFSRPLILVISWLGQTYIILDRHQMWEVFRKVPKVQSQPELKVKVKWKLIMTDTLYNLMEITSINLKVIKEVKMDKSWYQNHHQTVKVLLFLSTKISLRPQQLGKMRLDNSL